MSNSYKLLNMGKINLFVNTIIAVLLNMIYNFIVSFLLGLIYFFFHYVFYWIGVADEAPTFMRLLIFTCLLCVIFTLIDIVKIIYKQGKMGLWG